MNPIYALAGVSVTILLALLTLFFRAGHLAARVEALEQWRARIRADMHEISDVTTKTCRLVDTLRCLIGERTERRRARREEQDLE